MAISILTTEDGNEIVQETVAGITGASSLNDTTVETIFNDRFVIDPLTNGWLVGSGWAWDAGNQNMEIV